jgi:hypothetical protein
VVTSGFVRLADGSKVRVLEEAPEAGALPAAAGESGASAPAPHRARGEKRERRGEAAARAAPSEPPARP